MYDTNDRDSHIHEPYSHTDSTTALYTWLLVNRSHGCIHYVKIHRRFPICNNTPFDECAVTPQSKKPTFPLKNKICPWLKAVLQQRSTFRMYKPRPKQSYTAVVRAERYNKPFNTPQKSLIWMRIVGYRLQVVMLIALFCCWHTYRSGLSKFPKPWRSNLSVQLEIRMIRNLNDS